jgi:hypothetical protein
MSNIFDQTWDAFASSRPEPVLTAEQRERLNRGFLGAEHETPASPPPRQPTECPTCGAGLAWYPPGIQHHTTSTKKLICRRAGIAHFSWRPGDPVPGEPIRVVAERVDAGEPVVPDLIGYDFQDICRTRLDDDLARVVGIHFPIYGRPPRCAGCVTDKSYGGPTKVGVEWPCKTAALALG